MVERLTTLTLFNGAIDRVREAGWTVLVVAAVAAILMLGLITGGQLAGVAGADGMGLKPPYLIYAAISSVFGALVSAVGMRALLGRRGAALFTVDAGALEGVALLAVTTFVMSAASAAYLEAMQSAGLTSPDVQPSPQVAERLGGVALLVMVGYVGGIWLAIRLMLWPIGRIMGAVVGPAQSWRATHRCVRGVVLADLMFALPLVLLVGIVAMGQSAAAGGPLSAAETAVSAAGGIAWMLASNAVSATVYRERIEKARGVAEVFR